MTIGERIRMMRIDRRMTQNELAEKIGVANKIVCMWETGKRDIAFADLSKAAGCFGVSVSQLVEDMEPNDPNARQAGKDVHASIHVWHTKEKRTEITIDDLRAKVAAAPEGQRIHVLRQELGLSQADFGARIGLEKTVVSKYESGNRTPSDRVKTLIANAFGVQIGGDKTPRLCVVCGKPIPEGQKRSKYCSEECHKEWQRRRNREPKAGKPKPGVYVWRVCTDCGMEFYGHIKSFRCPACAKEAEKRSNRQYRQRKKAGKERPIGSTDLCENCGKPYTVNSGLQRYCPDCAPMMLQKNDRAASVEWSRKTYADPKKRAEKNEAKRQKTPLNVQCPICGKTFQAKKSQVYCSEACRKEAEREYNRKSREKARQNRPPTPTRRCLVCGKEFTPASHNAVYCSQKCRLKNASDKRRDKQNAKGNEPEELAGE